MSRIRAAGLEENCARKEPVTPVESTETGQLQVDLRMC